MKLPYLSSAGMRDLRSHISDNKEIYLEGRQASLVAESDKRVVRSRIDVDDVPELVAPSSADLRDSENARIVYSWLSKLTPVQAADPRVWSYLTHASYADYSFKRWPISSDTEVITRVKERYFVEGGGLASLARNAISRLWWFGYLTYDEKRGDRFEMTDVLLSLQDIQNAFLERAIGRSRHILRSVLTTWKKRLESGEEIKAKGKVVQTWAKLIRLHGSVAVLDAFSPKQLDNLLRAKLAVALKEEWLGEEVEGDD